MPVASSAAFRSLLLKKPAYPLPIRLRLALPERQPPCRNFRGSAKARAWSTRAGSAAYDSRSRRIPQKQCEVSGYTTLSCAYTRLMPSLHKPATAMDVADFLRPVSSILTGTVTNGIFQFHVDKTLGDRCPPTSFTLTPFSTQLAAEWHDAACGGSQMLLTKAK